MIHQQNGNPKDVVPVHEFYSRLINESGVALSGGEEELLSRDLKFYQWIERNNNGQRNFCHAFVPKER